MNLEVIGAAGAVVGALLWIRRDLRHDIAEVRADMRAINSRIDAINGRIDTIILASKTD